MIVYLVTLINWKHDPNTVFSVWDSREAAEAEAQRIHHLAEIAEFDVNKRFDEPDAAARASAVELPEHVKAEAIRRGYRFEVSEDGLEERLVRPDGTVAVIARWKKRELKS